MTDTVVIEERFRGPPNSGNGGYVAGLVAKFAGGHRAVYMRAPAPLAIPLELEDKIEPVRLTYDGKTIAEAVKSDQASLPEVPPPPTLEEARIAGQEAACSHPICYCCGNQVSSAVGLRVHTGQLTGAPDGWVAGVWNVDAEAIGTDGSAAEEHVWAAIDCPGSYAWLAKDGVNGGLTAMMQAEVFELPRAGDECIVFAWPISQMSERRRLSGTALFDSGGKLMARASQLWVRPS